VTKINASLRVVISDSVAGRIVNVMVATPHRSPRKLWRLIDRKYNRDAAEGRLSEPREGLAWQPTGECWKDYLAGDRVRAKSWPLIAKFCSGRIGPPLPKVLTE